MLIGTQMVAKGHDFPDVTLGVVLDADATLRFPDFRAEERTFALIAQLAGRVGRGGDGRVLVQTIAPEARAIVHAAAPRQRRLPRRRARAPRARSRYPPFSHLIRIVCSRRRAAPAARCAAARDALRERLRRAARGAATRACSGPRALFRLRGRERQVLVVKAAERRAGRARGRGGRAARSRPRARHAGVSFSVDVDPQ